MPHDAADRPKDDLIRLEHMLATARSAAGFCIGRSRDDLDRDEMLRRALIHCFLEVGEAASRVSDSTRQRCSAVPWKQVVGMRHRLIHVYWRIDLDVLWNTVIHDIPALIRGLEADLKSWSTELP